MKLSTVQFFITSFVLLVMSSFTATSVHASTCPPPEDTFSDLSKWKTTASGANTATVGQHSGKQVLKQTFTDTSNYVFTTHTLCNGFFGSIMVDFYDDGDTTKGTLFSVYSGDIASQASAQMEMIGVGVWSTVHNNTYAYRITSAGDPTAATISSGIQRSTGWHVFELIVTPEGAYGAIDGIALGWRTPTSLNTHAQFKSQGVRSIGIVSTWGLASTNYYARLRSRPLSSVNQKLGFMFSGGIVPPQLYPSTFSQLNADWTTSYAPSLAVLNLTSIPLANKNEPDGRLHVANVTCCGHAENGGTDTINVTPWTRPTLFNVYSRERLAQFVQQNGFGTYYLVGSEPNVMPNHDYYGQKFDFANHPYWNLSYYWSWAINNGGFFVFDSVEKNQGDQSLKVSASTPNQNWVKSVHITAKPNTKYRVKVDMKTDNVQAAAGQGAGLHVYENGVWPGSASGGGRSELITGTNNWRTYTFDFTTKSTTSYVELFIGMGFAGNATGTVWFDNIIFTPVNADNTAEADTAIVNIYPGKYFAAIFNYYVTTLKELDPTAKIVGPNFITFSALPDNSSQGAFGQYIPGKVWFDEFIAEYTARYGGEPQFDIYATHVYDNHRPWNFDQYVSYAKFTVDDFRNYITAQYGANAKVWITEFGVQRAGVADTETARFLQEMHSYLMNRGDIDKWFWAWSYAPTTYPFSGYLFTSNLQSAPLTQTGNQFRRLAILTAGLSGGRVNPTDTNYNGFLEKSEWSTLLQRFYDTNVILDTDNNNVINSLDYAKSKQLPL